MTACPEEFFNAYIETALWADYPSDETDGTDPNDNAELAEEALSEMRADCDAFYSANYDDLNCDGVRYGPDFGQDGRAGHDFWLTRNRHGSGFWGGDWPEPQATRLTEAAHAFGEVSLYVGDDGVIYQG